MSSGPSITRGPAFEKSNIELINSLRSNIEASKLAFREFLTDGIEDSTHTQESCINSRKIPYNNWTAHKDGILYVPAIDFSQSGLMEERSEYNITVKLFFLPDTSLSKRYKYAQEAVGLVLQELHVPSIDLLIVSFPGVSFDADDEEQEESGTREQDATDDIESMVETWRALEQLHADGLALQIGVSEFGSERLAKLLPETITKPSVDQINVRDCCVVPKSLILYAKEQNIELLTHNDCTNILSRGTIRELLGSGGKGAGVIVGPDESSDELNRKVEPQWVVKYTAVVRDRGVIENKGYFAAAELYD